MSKTTITQVNTIYTTKRTDTFKNDKYIDYIYISVTDFAEKVKRHQTHASFLTIQDFMEKYCCDIDTTLEVLGYLYHEGAIKQFKGIYYIFV